MSVVLYDSGLQRYPGDIVRVPGARYEVVTQTEADGHVAAGWATRSAPDQHPDHVPATASVDALLDAMIARLDQMSAEGTVHAPALPTATAPLPPSDPSRAFSRAGSVPAPSGAQILSDGTISDPSGTLASDSLQALLGPWTR